MDPRRHPGVGHGQARHGDAHLQRGACGRVRVFHTRGGPSVTSLVWVIAKPGMEIRAYNEVRDMSSFHECAHYCTTCGLFIHVHVGTEL